MSVMMMMMNCFCGMVDQPKAFSFIFSRDHYQRSSKSWISDTSRAVFEPAQNLTSGFVEWSSADNHSGDNHYTTGPQVFVQYKVHNWTRKTKTNDQFQTQKMKEKTDRKTCTRKLHNKPGDIAHSRQIKKNKNARLYYLVPYVKFWSMWQSIFLCYN